MTSEYFACLLYVLTVQLQCFVIALMYSKAAWFLPFIVCSGQNNGLLIKPKSLYGRPVVQILQYGRTHGIQTFAPVCSLRIRWDIFFSEVIEKIIWWHYFFNVMSKDYSNLTHRWKCISVCVSPRLDKHNLMQQRHTSMSEHKSDFREASIPRDLAGINHPKPSTIAHGHPDLINPELPCDLLLAIWNWKKRMVSNLMGISNLFY